MKGFRYVHTVVTFTAVVLSGCVVSPSGPQPAARTDLSVSGRVVASDRSSHVEILFSSDDRRHIHDYYYREPERERNKNEKRAKRKELPPGLAKREELPPGLQRQIRRNGQLPPGLEGERLPDDLEYRLSPLPAGYIRLRIGRDIVLMNQSTRVTVDVIKNIYPE